MYSTKQFSMQERIQRWLRYESERKYYDLEAENCFDESNARYALYQHLNESMHYT